MNCYCVVSTITTFVFFYKYLNLISDNEDCWETIEKLKDDKLENLAIIDYLEKSQIEDSKLIESLKDKIDSINAESVLELISDWNITRWDLLFTKCLFEFYLNSNSFAHLINFSKEQFNTKVLEMGVEIDNFENSLNILTDSLFKDNSTYYDYNVYNYNLAKFESRYFFNKLRFLYSDVVINNLIYDNNPNFGYNLQTEPNILKLFKEYNYNGPYSFDEKYSKSLQINNYFKKTSISSFDY